MRAVATAKASLFRSAAGRKPKHPDSTNVVVGPFSQPRRELPPEERALWEAAIQLDLVTVNTAEEQVARGKTVATWMAGQGPTEGERKEQPRRSVDRPLLLASVTFNLVVLVALAAAIAWGFKHLI